MLDKNFHRIAGMICYPSVIQENEIPLSIKNPKLADYVTKSFPPGVPINQLCNGH